MYSISANLMELLRVSLCVGMVSMWVYFYDQLLEIQPRIHSVNWVNWHSAFKFKLIWHECRLSLNRLCASCCVWRDLGKNVSLPIMACQKVIWASSILSFIAFWVFIKVVGWWKRSSLPHCLSAMNRFYNITRIKCFHCPGHKQ